MKNLKKRTLYGVRVINQPQLFLRSNGTPKAKSFFYLSKILSKMKNYLFINGEQQFLTDAQTKLINYVLSPDAKDKAEELELISEIVIYNSEIPIDRKEKDALLTVRQLTEHLSEIKE